MNANNQNINQDWVYPDDEPQPTDDFFEQAYEYVGDKLVKRGRPRAASMLHIKSLDRFDQRNIFFQ